MQMFNQEVMSELIEGTTERFSSAKYNTLLGAAEKLVLQVRANQVSGTSPTVTVKLYLSADGVDWDSNGYTIVDGATLTAGSLYNSITGISAVVFGAFARFGVTLGGTSPSANVELIVCGRGEQGQVM